MKKLSKKELIKALEKAEANPTDAIGLIGEFGVVGLAGGGSIAIASTVLASTATTTVTAPVLGSTTLGSLLGAKVLTVSTIAAPVIPVIGWGIAGAAAAFGLVKLVKSGSQSDRKRAEYIKSLRTKISNYDKAVSSTTQKNIKMSRLAGMYALLLKLNAVDVESVETMFIGINNDSVDIDFALNNAKTMLDKLRR